VHAWGSALPLEQVEQARVAIRLARCDAIASTFAC
jgi:hypothetical protein